MTTEEKKALIVCKVDLLIDGLSSDILDIATKILNSGCVDVKNYDSIHNSMILPKTILVAILQDFAEAYSCKGTSFEKQIKKDVKNIRKFL
jgi:RIO-like serine/threonine protein kinase